jgi:hypothetical protein
VNIAQLLEADPATMKLGDVVDAYRDIREVRLLMAKEVEAVEAAERKFKQHLIDNLEKSNEKGVFGLRFKALHKTKRIPKVKDGDWTAIHQHIYNTGEFDLLQKRLNDTAVMARLEAGETLPGIETMLVSEISVTKI